MKYFFAALGCAISWGIYNYFPIAFVQLVKVGGFSAGVAALGTVLTAGWVICLNKLSVFEKIEDLPSVGRERVMAYARKMRRRITGTITFNCILAFLSFALIFSSQIPAFEQLKLTSIVGYIVGATLGFWLGGSIDSWQCYSAIEATKEEFTLAQLEMKSRKAFLAKLRKDAAEKPVSRDDAHLNGYTKNA